MARKRKAGKKLRKSDFRYHSVLVAAMISRIMKCGKKSLATKIVYEALDIVGKKTKSDPVEVLEKAIDNIKPQVEVKSRRVGGATYQVPVEVSSDRQVTLALRWLNQFASARKGVATKDAIALELLDAYNNQGSAIRKRDETHKMAKANQAFAHFRW